MADSPADPTAQSPPRVTDPAHYWCYHCDKRVEVDTDPDDHTSLTCRDCSLGFVESIPQSPISPPRAAPHARDFNSHFLHVLRLLAQSERGGGGYDAPPPPPPDDRIERAEGDFFRIQIDTDDVDDDDDDDVDHDEDHDSNNNNINNTNSSGRSRDVVRLRLRDLAANRRNRILDWAEILMGLEDHSINLRLQMDGPDGFTADPEDYLDAAGYEQLLRDLAESDARRGAPPASQEAILALENIEIKSVDESVHCAVCKDGVGVGEVGKKLPCGHVYHKDCIVPWLGSRNSCPVCRYELATDDLEYEAERKRRAAGPSSSSSG